MEKDIENSIISAAELLEQKELNLENIRQSITTILKSIGEDPERDGLLRTPDRVARSYQELLSGYQADPVAIINDALFDVEYQEAVIVRDIEFYSMCEHHMLPILGRAHVAYLPNKKVLGLSKIPRIVDMYARRLQVQERMTYQIANFLNELLNPGGVAVVIEGLHLCSMIRGVQKHNARMTTSTMLGAYKTDLELRQEFQDHISRGAENLHL